MTKDRYNHQKIEKKWQNYWKERALFRVKVDKSKPKYYILDMFPYPSGSGLHVGHLRGYTATDILARYKRQKGYNVLHPMGWDSFGLQAEQYAIRTGTHPKITTKNNIDHYRYQLQSLGLSYDWEREFATSNPEYYKWTQWIFTLLYKKGLAYEADILVNYCPYLGTILANEEIEEGKSKEGGFPIERRPLRQWVLKITSYADRLLQDLELLDWPDHLKTLQRNWIGRKEGVQITFIEQNSLEPISVFTTRHDTLFGVTFLVLSPDHPLVEKVTTRDQKKEVEAYQHQAAKKSDLERTELAKEKSGVWTGSYAKNPINDALIPIWIADYVLMGYGTGAVMGVPGGDERDFKFAKKYMLPIIPPYEPDPHLPLEKGYRNNILMGKQWWTQGGKIINGKSKKLNIMHFDMQRAKDVVANWLETNQIGKRCVTYKLRDWLFSRQRYWGEPLPILHFEDGTKRLLDLDELPLILPDLSNYQPQEKGTPPLNNASKWVKITDPKTKKRAIRETNTMPQWAGSCWYYLRFCDPKNSNRAWDKEQEEYWMPVDMYVGGVEHAVLHLLYARFWHKVLYDCGYVSTIEPFHALRNQGLVTAKSYKKPGGGYVAPDHVEFKEGRCFGEGMELIEMVEKMSKSKLNGVNPDKMIETFGADALRLYSMFMGPFDQEKLWDSGAIRGCRRFLNRFHALVTSDKVCDTDEGLKLAHRVVNGVEQDIHKMLFNTAIAKMMDFVNHFSKFKHYSKQALTMVTQALYAFAPHLAEECWEHLGHTTLLSSTPYPQSNPTLLLDDHVTYVIQVNGKVRDKCYLPKGKSKEALIKYAKTKKNIEKYCTSPIIKVIYIPDRLLNIVTQPSKKT